MSFKFEIDQNREVFLQLLGDIHDELHTAFHKRNEETGLTKSQLAEAIGVDKSLITRKFNGSSNLTIESIADLAWAMNHYPDFRLIPLEDVNNNQATYDAVFATSYIKHNTTIKEVTIPGLMPPLELTTPEFKVRTA